MCACEPKLPEAAYLQALCQFRLGLFKAAYDSCKSFGSKGTHLGCSYVFAQSCLALEKYLEGILALDRSKGLWHARNNWNKHTDTRRQQLPDAPAVHCLLGKLWQAHKETTKAIDCYAESLKLNPFMWDAFLALCDLGVNVRIPNVFKTTPEMMSVLASGLNEEPSSFVREDLPPSYLAHTHQSTMSQNPINSDPFSISTNRANGDPRFNTTKSALFEKFNGATSIPNPLYGAGGPDFGGIHSPTSPRVGVAEEVPWKHDLELTLTEDPNSSEPPLAPVRKPRTLYGLGMDFSVDAPPRMKTNSWRLKSKTHVAPEESDHAHAHMASTNMTGVAHPKRTLSGHLSQTAASTSSTHLAAANDPMAPQRRSARLFNQIRPQSSKFSASTSTLGIRDMRELKKAKATGTKGRNAQVSTVGRVVSGNRKHGDHMDIDVKEPRNNITNGMTSSHPKPAVNEKVKEYEGLVWLLDLFAKLGSGYFALSHFRCQEAFQMFNAITPNQRDTPWVLSQMGRALYEQSLYSEAGKYFARVRTMAPSRLDDMEVYSTILWQLHSEVNLAYLAYEITDINRLSPQAWCALGNSFSLQRNHDEALKCFKRAAQINPKFAYAFTLQGHEHIANEEYEDAIAAFRNGIGVQNRHYNAWYGLGRVYEKQGKYDVAEQHYRTAASINPRNAVLLLSIGTVLEKMKNPTAALHQFTKSIELAPKASLARFKKARVLLTLQEPKLALTELKVLKDIAPDEANVHFLLGRVYKLLRQKGNAIKHFTIALNLDPKVSQQRFEFGKRADLDLGIALYQRDDGANGRRGRRGALIEVLRVWKCETFNEYKGATAWLGLVFYNSERSTTLITKFGDLA